MSSISVFINNKLTLLREQEKCELLPSTNFLWFLYILNHQQALQVTSQREEKYLESPGDEDSGIQTHNSESHRQRTYH